MGNIEQRESTPTNANPVLQVATRNQKWLVKKIVEYMQIDPPQEDTKECYRQWLKVQEPLYRRKCIDDKIAEIARQKAEFEKLRYIPDYTEPPVAKKVKKRKVVKKGAKSRKETADIVKGRPKDPKKKAQKQKLIEAHERRNLKIMAKAQELELRMQRNELAKQTGQEHSLMYIDFAKQGEVFPFTEENVENRAIEYIKKCVEKDLVPNSYGIAGAFLVSPATYKTWLRGEGAMKNMPEVVEKLRWLDGVMNDGLIQGMLKQTMSVPGSIFALKNLAGWKDQNETVVVPVMTPSENREDLLKQAAILPMQDAEVVE